MGGSLCLINILRGGRGLVGDFSSHLYDEELLLKDAMCTCTKGDEEV